MMFDLSSIDMSFPRNILSLCIQPDEGIHLNFEAKVPGSMQESRSVEMQFHYRDAFKQAPPDAYERLILDAIQGDPALFTRSDEIEAAWALIDPIIQAWEESQEMPAIYPRGSWGPKESESILLRDNCQWIYTGCLHEEGE